MRGQFGNRRGGAGRGRNRGNRPGSGPGGQCVCPECGKRISHTAGVPCNTQSCPACGAQMIKE